MEYIIVTADNSNVAIEEIKKIPDVISVTLLEQIDVIGVQLDNLQSANAALEIIKKMPGIESATLSGKVYATRP
jgi:hypothetical protein